MESPNTVWNHHLQKDRSMTILFTVGYPGGLLMKEQFSEEQIKDRENHPDRIIERLKEYNRSLTDENLILHKGMEILQREVNRITELLERVLSR